jgi:hypothetical protein
VAAADGVEAVTQAQEAPVAAAADASNNGVEEPAAP